MTDININNSAIDNVDSETAKANTPQNSNGNMIVPSGLGNAKSPTDVARPNEGRTHNSSKHHNKKHNKFKPVDDYIPPFGASELNQPIESLNLTESTISLLKSGNNSLILDLVKKEEKEFYRIIHFNKKNLKEVTEALKKIGMFVKPTPISTTVLPSADTDITNTMAIEAVKKNNDVARNNNSRDNDKNNNRLSDNKANNTKRNEKRNSEPRQDNGTNAEPRTQSRDFGRTENSSIKKDDVKIKTFSPSINIAEQEKRKSSTKGNLDTSSKNSNQILNFLKTDKPSKMTIDALKLNPYVSKLIKSLNIRFAEELTEKTEGDLFKIKGFKKKDYFEVVSKLADNNMYLKGEAPISLAPTKPPRPIVEKIKEKQDIYIKINKNNKWGFADRNGKEVVTPIYDEVFTYHEEICCVEDNEHFGYIDRNGEVIVPLIYQCAGSFSEGHACVFKGEKCGYIDKDNNVVIDFKFDAGTIMENGSCRIKKDGKWGELWLNDPTEIRWIN